MKNNTHGNVELYLTIPLAAQSLGIPASTLRRAVNSNLVPSYQPFGKRTRVRLSEIISVIESEGDLK